MTDRELLEAAARAAGYRLEFVPDQNGNIRIHAWSSDICTEWNPLTDDGDALRLAVKLNLLVDCDGETHESYAVGGGADESISHGKDKLAATRLVIVRAAAEIGRAMK